MITVEPFELPPQQIPTQREERRIDFNPYGSIEQFEEGTSYKFDLVGTSNVSGCTPRSAGSIGSRWYIRTTASAFENSLEDVATIDQPKALSVAEQLAEMKRLTGFGWEQLSKLLGCTRQTLHLWIDGNAISDGNRDRLARLHATLRYLDRGNAEANRTVMDMACDGSTVAELLANERFADVKALVARGPGRPDARWGKAEDDIPGLGNHWLNQIPESENAGESAEIHSEPQTFKRLQLRKG